MRAASHHANPAMQLCIYVDGGRAHLIVFQVVVFHIGSVRPLKNPHYPKSKSSGPILMP
jgi:hypothetical protein